MSNTIQNGAAIKVNIEVGESLKLNTITGTYTATIIAGAGAGTALATASDAGATYGPYASAIVVEIRCSADGLTDFEVGVTPTLDYVMDVGATIDPLTGRVSLLVGSTAYAAGSPINIQDAPFLAVGDGVHDDTSAIQAAINYAHTQIVASHNKCEVQIPDGEFKFTQTITLYSNMSLSGPGSLVFAGTGVAIQFEDGATSIDLSQFSLKTSVAAATIGIYANNATRINVDHVQFLGNAGAASATARWSIAALNFHSTLPSNTFLLNITNCKFQYNAADSILLDGTGGSSIVNIGNNAFQQNDGIGIHQKDGAVATIGIIGNEIEGFGSVVGSRMIKLGFVISGVIEQNHFEHSPASAEPIIELGTDFYARGVRVSNNIFAGAGVGVTDAIILLGNFQNGKIANNSFSLADYSLKVTSTLFGSVIEGNTLTSPTAIMSSASLAYLSSSTYFDSGLEQISFKANQFYSGVVTKKNAAQRGTMSVKPGIAGNAIQAIAGGVVSDVVIGDFFYNAAPVSGGYIGWVCAYGGRVHYSTGGTLTSGSNVVASITGAIWDWTVGDLICTDTDALGIPAGTTVTAKAGSTLTLSANATASGTVSLFGARFKGFGLIEV